MSSSQKIHLLSDSVANQIAAGEVVQRPASVVKELLENAVDAGAQNIQLIVEDGGKTLIKVIDDGCGMHHVDARTAFQRHATSKIREAEDFLNINTYGFRGEALSSIASVAEVELITRTMDSDIGRRIVVEESTIKCDEAIATAVGTQIAVSYLFRKMPGRRNFLKSTPVEMKHVIDEFQRVALAYPKIAFVLLQKNAELYRLPASKLSHRIVHLFGKNYQKKLIPCEEETSKLQLQGYIGSPSEAKKTRGGQFFFVNGRFVKSPYLHHAVKQAFDKLLPADAFPFYVLLLTVPPHEVDINVHPTKTEVKFQEERLLYALVSASVRKALATHNCMHTIDFNRPTTEAFFTPNSGPITLASTATSRRAGDNPPFYTTGGKNWVAVEEERSVNRLPFQQLLQGEEESLERGEQKQFDFLQKSTEVLLDKMQLHKHYILAQVKSGLLLIDQRAAYERILYERYTKTLKQEETGTQKLLFPHEITLQLGDLALVQACQQELQELGFRFEITSQTELCITGQPVNLQMSKISMGDLLINLLEQYKMNVKDLSIPKNEKWARALAKRANLTLNTVLTGEEMNNLVDQLFMCQNPSLTPDGEPIWRIFNMGDLAKLLKTGF